MDKYYHIKSYYHMNLCGGTWVCCDGECETCTRGHTSASNFTMEYKTCPFCGGVHEFKPWLNIICHCGAKYYFMEKFWLHRKTGERRSE